MNRRKIVLVYDGDCPVCSNYCQAVRIRNSVGDLELINSRTDSPIVKEISEKGLDLDQGMVLKIDDCMYFGADTIHALALLGSRSGGFNRLNYWVFKSKSRSRYLYPVLRFGRNVLLRILGRSKIDNLERHVASKS